MSDFLVNRVGLTQKTMLSKVGPNERQMASTVDVLEVELVHEHGEQGTVLKTFWTPDEQEAARKKYVQGETVTLED